MLKGAMIVYNVENEETLEKLRGSFMARSPEWSVCWPDRLSFPCFLAVSDNLEIQMTSLLPMVRKSTNTWAYQDARYRKLPDIDARLVTVVQA